MNVTGALRHHEQLARPSSYPQIRPLTPPRSSTSNAVQQSEFGNLTLEQTLDDLASRFVVNLPPDELDNMDRVCFQLEQAHWYYEDFIRPNAANSSLLPSVTLKHFLLMMFKSCPLLHEFVDQHAAIWTSFMAYKERVPVCGAILISQSWDKVLLVKGWQKGASWSFPRGKINKLEPEGLCAIREVLEETGFDISDHFSNISCQAADNEVQDLLREPEYIELVMKEQKIRLYLIPNVLEDTKFETKTRKEISKIDWFKVSDLPTWSKDKGVKIVSEPLVNTTGPKTRFYMVTPFVSHLKLWIGNHKPKPLQKSKSTRTRNPKAHHTDINHTGYNSLPIPLVHDISSTPVNGRTTPPHLWYKDEDSGDAYQPPRFESDADAEQSTSPSLADYGVDKLTAEGFAAPTGRGSCSPSFGTAEEGTAALNAFFFAQESPISAELVKREIDNEAPQDFRLASLQSSTAAQTPPHIAYERQSSFLQPKPKVTPLQTIKLLALLQTTDPQTYPSPPPVVPLNHASLYSSTPAHANGSGEHNSAPIDFKGVQTSGRSPGLNQPFENDFAAFHTVPVNQRAPELPFPGDPSPEPLKRSEQREQLSQEVRSGTDSLPSTYDAPLEKSKSSVWGQTSPKDEATSLLNIFFSQGVKDQSSSQPASPLHPQPSNLQDSKMILSRRRRPIGSQSPLPTKNASTDTCLESVAMSAFDASKLEMLPQISPQEKQRMATSPVHLYPSNPTQQLQSRDSLNLLHHPDLQTNRNYGNGRPMKKNLLFAPQDESHSPLPVGATVESAPHPHQQLHLENDRRVLSLGKVGSHEPPCQTESSSKSLLNMLNLSTLPSQESSLSSTLHSNASTSSTLTSLTSASRRPLDPVPLTTETHKGRLLNLFGSPTPSSYGSESTLSLVPSQGRNSVQVHDNVSILRESRSVLDYGINRSGQQHQNATTASNADARETIAPCKHKNDTNLLLNLLKHNSARSSTAAEESTSPLSQQQSFPSPIARDALTNTPLPASSGTGTSIDDLLTRFGVKMTFANG